jgi:hypothetical protein
VPLTIVSIVLNLRLLPFATVLLFQSCLSEQMVVNVVASMRPKVYRRFDNLDGAEAETAPKP